MAVVSSQLKVHALALTSVTLPSPTQTLRATAASPPIVPCYLHMSIVTAIYTCGSISVHSQAGISLDAACAHKLLLATRFNQRHTRCARS
jgi:hypothetical protein